MRFTDDDIRAEMERAIDAAGSLRRFAKKCGLSPTFVSMVRSGASLPGPTLAEHLGFCDDGKRWIKKEQAAEQDYGGDDWGCDHCRNDGKLNDMNCCPVCDAEFVDDCVEQ